MYPTYKGHLNEVQFVAVRPIDSNGNDDEDEDYTFAVEEGGRLTKNNLGQGGVDDFLSA